MIVLLTSPKYLRVVYVKIQRSTRPTITTGRVSIWWAMRPSMSSTRSTRVKCDSD